MNALSKPIAVIAGLFAVWSTPDVPPQMACVPADKSAIPPDYLFYHALASPNAALSNKRDVHVPCPPSKIIRT